VSTAGRAVSGSFATIGGWWEPFAQWTRVGAVAAVAALALTAWGLWDTSAASDRLAYEAAVEAMSTPLDSAGRPMSDSPREKTVSDLFRY
jgi:type VI protein secretion system component VasK